MKNNMFFMCVALILSGGLVFGTSQTDVGITGVMAAQILPVVFSLIIGMSCSPFIALTVISGVGSFLNSGLVNSDAIPFSGFITELPLASFGVFVVLLVITSLKGLLNFAGTTKILCDATLGKLEDLTATLCVIIGPYLVITTVTVYAAEPASGGVLSSAASGVLAVIASVVVYGMYYVVKTLVAALGVFTFLIPGASVLFTTAKYTIVSGYTILTFVNPTVAFVIGLMLLVVALIAFSWARRMVKYYRRIYLFPFLNAAFRGGRIIPLVSKRIPRGVLKGFGKVDICIAAFFMNRTSPFKQREMCHFIRVDGKNYLYKMNVFGKEVKIPLEGKLYVERCFRFVRIFSEEEKPSSVRGIHIVISREQVCNIEELLADKNFVDYNIILDGRKRLKSNNRAAGLFGFRRRL